MKKIEIPDGNRAEWVNTSSTRVDGTPKDVRDRIKTFEDACADLGDEHPLVIQYRYTTAAAHKDDPIVKDFIVYLKLLIITTALNEGWEPTFEKDEKRWYPWFDVKQGDFVYVRVAGSYSGASYSVLLSFKTSELAEYAGKQFIEIYKDFCYEKNKL